MAVPAAPGSSQAGRLRKELSPSGIGRSAFSKTQIESRPLTGSFVGSGDSNEGRIRNKMMLKSVDTQAWRDRSHELVTGSPQTESVYRNVLQLHPVLTAHQGRKTCSYLLTWPPNLLKSTMAREWQRYLTSLRCLSHCEKKNPPPRFL